MKKPIKIAITGSTGNISYSLIYRIASGAIFGPDQPVELSFVEIKSSENVLYGVMMELEDCASSLLHAMHYSFDLKKGFRDADFIILIGARPRTQGMERSHLLTINTEIFYKQGLALNESVSSDAHVIVVGNPTNTNMLVAMHAAKDLPAQCFSCLMRLDHNRTQAMLAKKLKVLPNAITNITIWGNHSAKQFPDIDYCKVNGKPVLDFIDHEWQVNELIPTVQQRGAKIIEVRGKSSAASAANAVIDHIKTLYHGTAQGDWTSMGVLSDGSYGVPEGIVFSYPVTTKNNTYEIVPDLNISSYSKRMLQENIAELQAERDLVKELLK